jgi:hypothetical protein
MSFDIGPYDPCPCGSGAKYKFCCAAKAKANRHGKFPVGTVAYYGPDDKTTTKIVAGVILREDAEPILERWVGTSVVRDPKIADEIKRLFAKHGVKNVVVTDGNLGCPHEEGEDFPDGEDCPFCPFWAGKQGTAQRDDFEDNWDELDDDDDEEDEDEDEPNGDEDGEVASAIDGEGDDFDEQFARVQAILGDAEMDFDQAVNVLLAHLQANLRLPCEVTGIEDFRWEEPYVLGGWSRAEYKRLKKTQPSYTDRFELLSLDRDEISEWMMFGGQDIGARVRRLSDGKEFVLGLAELEPTDKRSPNYRHIRDYAVWFVNSR